MGLKSSLRALHRVPVLGHGLRYVERLIALPWAFHTYARAAGEHQAHLHATLVDHLHAQQAAYAEAMRAQSAGLSEHLANVVRDTLSQLVADHLRAAVSEPVQQMVAEFRLGMAEVATAQQALADNHAGCYDRVADQLRRQADLLRTLADRIESLNAAHPAHRTAA